MAGAVLRPTGSTIIARGFSPIASNCRSISSAWRLLQTTIGAVVSAGRRARRAVTCSIVSSPTSGCSCLGIRSLDSGHNRVPLPPDRITGVVTFPIAHPFARPPWLGHGVCSSSLLDADGYVPAFGAHAASDAHGRGLHEAVLVRRGRGTGEQRPQARPETGGLGRMTPFAVGARHRSQLRPVTLVRFWTTVRFGIDRTRRCSPERVRSGQTSR